MAKTLEQFPEHLQKIGLLAIESNNIDATLELIFRTVSGIPPELTATIFGSLQSQKIRRELIEDLAEVQLKDYPEFVEEFRELNKRLMKFAKRRAQIIHSVYVAPVSKRGKDPIYFSPYEDSRRKIPITELDDAIAKAKRINQGLRRFGLSLLKIRGRRPLVPDPGALAP